MKPCLRHKPARRSPRKRVLLPGAKQANSHTLFYECYMGMYMRHSPHVAWLRAGGEGETKGLARLGSPQPLRPDSEQGAQLFPACFTVPALMSEQEACAFLVPLCAPALGHWQCRA